MKETRVRSACEMKTSWSIFFSEIVYFSHYTIRIIVFSVVAHRIIYYARLDYMNSTPGHKVVFESISIVMSSVCTTQTDPEVCRHHRSLCESWVVGRVVDGKNG